MTWRSDTPFVLICACQSTPVSALLNRTLASISSKFPTWASGTTATGGGGLCADVSKVDAALDCGIVPTASSTVVDAYATAPRNSTPRLIAITRRLLNFLIFMSPLFTYVMLLFVFNRSRARDPAVYLAANCSGRAAQYRMRLPISTVSRVKNCRGRCTNPQCAIPKFFRARPRFPLSITKAGKELPNCNVAGKFFAWLRSTTTVEG